MTSTHGFRTLPHGFATAGLPLLAELLSPGRIRIPLAARDKDGALRELAGVLARAGGVPDEEAAILRAVREREAVLSTGIGGGVAIPHGKTGVADGLWLAVGTTSEPLDFDSLDGRPVRLVFMLVGPPSAAGAHVKALSRIGRLLRREDVRDRLAGARTPEEFLAQLREAETP